MCAVVNVLVLQMCARAWLKLQRSSLTRSYIPLTSFLISTFVKELYWGLSCVCCPELGNAGEIV